MKAAELLMHCLENEAVRYIFGVPGEEIMDLLDALRDSPITFIPTRHEQGAAFMADVYGRLSGRAGVCLSTLGPGATNLVTGVADANVDHSPVVALTGQAGLDRMHKESHQYLDLVALFRPITKWNTQLKRADTIPETVRKAFKLAQAEKCGVTHIDIPEDLAKVNVDGDPLLEQWPPHSEPLASQVEMAARIISEARHPIVLAGNGVVRAEASAALVRFAEALNIPVATTFMAKGVIPFSHPLALGTGGLRAHDYISCGFDVADVVIAVGYDLVECTPALWNHQRDKRIVHVDLSPAEVDAAYTVAVEVIGDLSTSLAEMAARTTPSQASCRRAGLRDALVAEIEEYRRDTSFPVKPQRLLCDLRAALAPEDILISDVGAHKLWIARLYPCEQPNTCIISNGFASMGLAVPVAVAAKLLFPSRKVVAATGDGSFLMNSQELETAVRLGVPFVTLIFNDGGYGLIGWKQQAQFGREAFVKFGNPDFVRYAESFGARGYRVEAADDLPPILHEAFLQKGPVVIDCPVDYRENLARLCHRTSSNGRRLLH